MGNYEKKKRFFRRSRDSNWSGGDLRASPEGFSELEVPKNGGFMRGNPIKWMIYKGTHIAGNLHSSSSESLGWWLEGKIVT